MVCERRCPTRLAVGRVFTADPQCVAELYAQEWEREWGCDDVCSFEQELRSNCALREAHVGDAGEWAYELDLSAENIRKACLSSPSKTSIGLDQRTGLTGRYCQAVLRQLYHTNSATFAVHRFVGQEKRT